VGLLAKKPEGRTHLGSWLAPMLDCMGDRGADSAGLAVYSPLNEHWRYSLDCPDESHRRALATELRAFDPSADITVLGRVATLVTHASPAVVHNWLERTATRLLSTGHSIQLFKDVGHPRELIDRYRVRQMHGTHAVGHTRMATESAVSLAHAHPFTAGEDFCLVHNGSLSNPNSVRRKLERHGIKFETDNDTEAACRFLEYRLSRGDSLETALEAGKRELDGFYTLLIGTANRLVLLRDPFACKPAVVAETKDYVAVSSEFRALAHLPGIGQARVYEPVPEQIYSWAVAS